MITSTTNTFPEGFEPSKDGSHAVFMKPIEASPNDDRSYRLIRLPNELEVLLVHDPTTDKSGAAMDVHVGHLTDPDNLQGLAHFLEHLLFMGSAKYPQENGYKEYLAQHAGVSNASTFLDNTNFRFEVGHEHLEGALDRLAQFFIAPAFSENCKDREIRAVDSEFKRNLQEDSRRLFQIVKHTCSRDHPYWHFGTGNLITLQDNPTKAGIDVRAELIAFYHKYYSANIMKLVIVGRDPLDQLSEWAVEKFSEIRNLGINPPVYPNPPLTSKELLTTIYMKPVKDTRSIEIKFPFPDETLLYKVKPSNYICHLLGHEGTGSVLSLLKRLGWANGVSAVTMPAGIGHSFLKMTIDLTREGLKHHEDVVVIVFQYIALMRQNGVKDYIWDELVSLAATAFRFKEKARIFQHAITVAREMQHVDDPQWYLSGSDLIRERDDKLVQSCMDGLRVDNWRGLIMTQDPSIIAGGVFTETEQWYGTEYHVANTNPALLERLTHIEFHPDLHLPVPNEFIATDFETHKIEVETPLAHPNLIQHSPLVRLWHKKDDVFWVPKVNMYFLLRSPVVYASPLTSAKTALVIALLNDSLSEQVYGAELAGLRYKIDKSFEGLILSIQGYNHKANLLLEKVIRSLKNFRVDPERFHRVKDKVCRRYQDRNKLNPVHHATYFLDSFTHERFWSYLEQFEELDSITAEDCENFVKDILLRLAVEGFVHGNVRVDHAKEAYSIVEGILQPRPLAGSERTMDRSRILPEGTKSVYSRITMDPVNLNSGIQYYLQVETAPHNDLEVGRETRALTLIFTQILKEPCFNQLRTKEQLGYSVASGLQEDNGTLGITVTIQSERDPIYLESRIENLFRERIALALKSMNLEEFNRQVNSAVVKKMEKPKNLKEESVKHWSQIQSGYFEFDQVLVDVEAMRKVTLDRLKEFFMLWIHPDGAKAKKLSVHIRSQKLPPQVDENVAVNGQKREDADQEKVEAGVEEFVRLPEATFLIKDEALFKANLELSRAPVPVVDLLRYSKL
ncbi:Insulinase (Peptidase M16) [Gryganskiella cystojenkinii]|nr:Insulinase (Peptidase M16) [Gryganskiella cystojenkinii]